MSLPDPIRSVPAEPGTLDAVLATARRRRARGLQAVGAAGAAVLLVSALAVSLGGGDGSQSLGVTDGGGVVSSESESPGPDDSPSPSPGAGEPSTAGSTVPSGAPQPTPTQSAGGGAPSDQPTVEPTPSPSARCPRPSGSTSSGSCTPPRQSSPQSPKPSPPPPTPSPAPAPTGDPSPEARGAMRRTYVEGAVQCKDGVQWCASARPAGTRPVDFFVRACRDADAGPGTMSISAAEADFAILKDGRQQWRWSSGMAFPAVQGSLEVQPGDCYEWSTTWRGVDDYNRPLPAGRYDGLAYVTAEEFPDPVPFEVQLG